MPSFTGGAQPELIYDYFGVPPGTYALQYKAPGHPALAARAQRLADALAQRMSSMACRLSGTCGVISA